MVTGAYRGLAPAAACGSQGFPAAGVHLFHALTGGRESNDPAARESLVIRVEAHDERMQDEGCALRSLTRSAEGSKASISIARGGPSLLSLKRQQDVHADVIVIGKDGQSTFGEFLLGLVAQRILSSAKCDVLVTPRASESAKQKQERGTASANPGSPTLGWAGILARSLAPCGT